MNKLTENLNIIQNLSNQPTENAEELKRAFDEAGNIIKNYLNEVVEPAVSGIEGNYTTTEMLSTFKKDINKTLEDLQKNINETIQGQIDDLTDSADKKAVYSDFIVENKSIHYVRTQSQGGAVTGTFSKSGYKPLGLVGHYYTNIYSATQNGAYVTAIDDTNISIQGYVARGNTGGTTEGDLIVSILWVIKK